MHDQNLQQEYDDHCQQYIISHIKIRHEVTSIARHMRSCSAVHIPLIIRGEIEKVCITAWMSVGA